MSEKKEVKQLVKEEAIDEENEDEQVEEKEDETTNDDSDEDDSDYEVIDVTENPLYQVLSAFFETEEGENVCDILKNLTSAVEENTKMMGKLLKGKK